MALRYLIVAAVEGLRVWHGRCMDLLRRVDGAECVGVVRASAGVTTDDTGRSLLSLASPFSDSMLAPLDAKRALVGWRVLPGDGDQFPSEGVRGLDLILVLGGAAWRPCTSGCEPPRLGVWAFDCETGSDKCVVPGVREILDQHCVTTVVLRRIVGEGSVPVAAATTNVIPKSLARTADAALRAASMLPARAMRAVLLTDRAPVCEASTGSLPESAPTMSPADLGRLKQTMRTAWWRDAARSFFRHEQWGIGLVQQPIHRWLEGAPPPRVRWVHPGKRSRIFADPFALVRGDGVTILIEDLDAARRCVRRGGKGVIAAGDWPHSGSDAVDVREWRCVLEESHHLSYPQLVEDNGTVYCIPESAEVGEVALYRAVQFPDRWERTATLLRGVALMDATVFRHGGRWWMLGAQADGEGVLTLHGYHAPELVGPWTPHPLNPLKSDVRSTRPAGGPFEHDGRLYRPAQDCGPEYGAAVAICEVTALTPTDFSERVVRFVRPDPDGPYPRGLHTLSGAGDWTVIDGKRRVFVPILFLGKVMDLLERAMGRRSR